MNAFINQAKKQKESEEKNSKKKSRPLSSILSGTFLMKEEVVQHLPYVFFLVFLGLLYIANGYMAEDAVRTINVLNKDIEELRSEYITSKSRLMYTSKQSELIRIIDQKGLGLEESYQPPKKIVVPEKQFKTIAPEE